MTHFIEATVADIKGGRESWRVLLSLALPSFAVSITIVVLSRLQ